MTQHVFDQATALTHDGVTQDGVTQDGAIARGHTDDRYKAFIGPFGGFTTATVLRAVLEQAKRLGDPLAITVNFCAPVSEGPFELHVREIRTNRSTQHWSVELSQGEQGIAISATVVLAIRRDSWSHQSLPTPQMPAAESVPLYAPHKPLAWIDRYRFRFETGAPAGGFKEGDPPRNALTRVWIADREPRTIDALSLASMADAFFGRIFLVRGTIVPFGTVSLTVYFHTSAEELAQEQIDSVFGTADASVFHKSYCDQAVSLWSRSGRLLATSQQIAYFKL